MTVFFTKGKNEDKKQIGLSNDISECYKIIQLFLEERNYDSPYMRISKYEDHLWIDVGSYTEFFEIWGEGITI